MKKLTGFIFALLLILLVVINVAFSFNNHTYIATVTDKQRIITGNKDSQISYYLVFVDKENGTNSEFKNEDNFLRFKFNSSDIEGELKVGKTYKFTVVGYRIPIFSEYENIISVKGDTP